MLIRARRLRNNISEFVKEENNKIENLNQKEWKYINYLIKILYPFYIFINIISTITNGPTIQNIFKVYNRLFTHLENQIEKLHNKWLF